ncbi:MAG TPA: oxidoreductase [Campylobacterales bacterium]|nr:oxidoreductase [Campylobacterales bacterium]
MKNLWDENEAKKYKTDPLAMRVYTSRLLGSDQNLVLHGGGNTSVKIGEYLYVKGSGWDLATIEKEGFPAVDLSVLKKMATLPHLFDTEMVRGQKEAMKDKTYPNPSVEAILHAIIPFDTVDHTHADAVVTISNTIHGKELLKEIYGKNMLIIDYVMPGFILAQKIYEQTKGIDWGTLDGIILLNHGIFTFDNHPKKSYDKMIKYVNMAEEYLEKHASIDIPAINLCKLSNDEISHYASLVSPLRGCEVQGKLIDTVEACYFATLSNANSLIHRGPLTPEHVIRTKVFPFVVESYFDGELEEFTNNYKTYFDAYSTDEIILDLAPRWAVIKNRGIVVFGKNEKENTILTDIISHTIHAMLQAEKLGGWFSLDKHDIYEMEYWELEQAKLKK